ncbi:MAG TPA: sialidase family protein [Verrucomicrobiae bacterium]
MKYIAKTCAVAFLALTLLGCDRSPANAAASGGGGGGGAAAAAADKMVKLSSSGLATYTDVLVGADGTIHSVYTERPAYGKPEYLYYRTSKDNGKTWSEVKNLSDDESGHSASYMRLVQDGAGRIYCVWKYIGANEILDGPGGYAAGRIVYRCLEGGTWSNRKALGDDKVPSYSWFAAVDPKGVAHIVWGQMTKEGIKIRGWGSATYAGLVRQATLNGANSVVKDILIPPPIVTKEEQAEMSKKGIYVKYEDTVPKKDGLMNLRGYVDAEGIAHFVGEDQGIKDGPSDQQTGNRIRHWDGKKFSTLYMFEKYQTYNNFNNPPVLALDANGKEWLIRAPEKSEKQCVRAYPITDGELGDFVNIIAPKSGPGLVANWQVATLAGGQLVLTAAFSETGGYDPEDLELYMSRFDGKGNWSAPQQLTNNGSKTTSSHKATGAISSVDSVTSYKTKFTAATAGKDGAPVLTTVNTESTIVGINSAGTTGSGRAVIVSSGGRVDNPYVFFLKP